MKIILLRPQRLLVPAGTELEVEDSNAALLLSVGAAVKADKEKVETAVKTPSATARKTTKNK